MTTNTALEIGLSLFDLSRILKKSQTEMSESTGVTTVAINRFFKGHSELSLSNFILVSRELGIDFLEKIISDEILKNSNSDKKLFETKAEMYSFLF